LPVGADTDEQLRREVFESKAFVGLITPASVASAYVSFELGARWGAKKHLALVLARGADAASLGGPLSGINALRLDSRNQVLQLADDISEYLMLPLEPSASYQSAIDMVVNEALKPAVAQQSSGSDVEVRPQERPMSNLTDDEIVGIIRSWINSSGAARHLKPIYYAAVDAELNLPPGSAMRLIEQAASQWYLVEQKGPNLIVFRESRLDLGPSRRDRLKGF
jgi:hypothetical protein